MIVVINHYDDMTWRYVYCLAAPEEEIYDPVEEERKKYERHVYVHDMLPFILVMRTFIDKV